ncbi:MAG: hypothetical protein AMS22_11315 [Thiotrichales bacterium SG8_50]|nr:MAG: hypothetical protein AMS22_11315 [Thiotrichales bacterium SG8_50]
MKLAWRARSLFAGGRLTSLRTHAQHRNSPTTLKPDEAGISSVIWCTGFKGNFDWIDGIELDSWGNPVHEKGESGQSGLYF